MQRLLCFVASGVIGSCTATHGSGSSTVASSHPILNVHLTEPNDAAMLNGFAESAMNSEHFLGALEKRAQANEDALGNHMSVINAQIHELVSIGSSLIQQLRGRSREQQLFAIPSDAAQREVHALKEQLDLVTRDVRVPDESAEDGFDASGPEAVAREKLMNAQKNFASIGTLVENGDQTAIESKLALAMRSPSQIGHPAPVQSTGDIASPCQLDAHACPQGWSDAGGVCVAHLDYAGPCASELALSGMSEQQLRAVAKYCGLELACQ